MGDENQDNLKSQIEYPIDELVNFLKQDTDTVIAFYGGEPLLQLNTMYKIMDLIPTAIFAIQTNAITLHCVTNQYLQKFHNVTFH